jgi:hypothetical protein
MKNKKFWSSFNNELYKKITAVRTLEFFHESEGSGEGGRILLVRDWVDGDARKHIIIDYTAKSIDVDGVHLNDVMLCNELKEQIKQAVDWELCNRR